MLLCRIKICAMLICLVLTMYLLETDCFVWARKFNMYSAFLKHQSGLKCTDDLYRWSVSWMIKFWRLIFKVFYQQIGMRNFKSIIWSHSNSQRKMNLNLHHIFHLFAFSGVKNNMWFKKNTFQSHINYYWALKIKEIAKI